MLPKKEGKRKLITHATPPPLTFNLSSLIPKILAFAIATAEKASLISNLAISLMVKPAFFNAEGIADEGAIPKSIGAQAASANAGKSVEIVARVSFEGGERLWEGRY